MRKCISSFFSPILHRRQYIGGVELSLTSRRSVFSAPIPPPPPPNNSNNTTTTAATLGEQYASTKSNIKGSNRLRCRTFLHVSLPADHPGALCDFLLPFKENKVNICQVFNYPHPLESIALRRTIFLDVEAHISDAPLQAALAQLRQTSINNNNNNNINSINNDSIVNIIGSWRVAWYPTRARDLDMLDQTTLAAGEELQDDPNNPHPGFHDLEYRERRRYIVAAAKNYKSSDPIPIIHYNANEHQVWSTVFDLLTSLFPAYACEEYNRVFQLMCESGVLQRAEPPQLAAVSEFLSDATGFTVRPVAGLLTSRDFLNALAFRVFFSTQYIRHHAQPLYTPEPDMVHDVVGHMPLLANTHFANFTQSIGLASLGASDEMIESLARVYWYSIEFGICKEAGEVRAYGAGILSSAGELQRAVKGGEAQILPWDPATAATLSFPTTKYQPLYFVANSFKDAQKRLEEWLNTCDRPFQVTYNPHSRTVQSHFKSTWTLPSTKLDGKVFS